MDNYERPQPVKRWKAVNKLEGFWNRFHLPEDCCLEGKITSDPLEAGRWVELGYLVEEVADNE